MSSSLRLALLLAGLTLTSCATGPTGPNIISYANQVAPFTTDLVNYAARNGEMTLQVEGDPFGNLTDREQVADNVSLPGYFTRAHVTTRPGPKTARNLRIVLAFNAAAGNSPDAFCRDLKAIAVQTVAPVPPTTRVAANFCVNDRAVASLIGEGPIGATPESPQFHQLMNEVMANLLTPTNHTMDGPGPEFPN